MQMLRTYFTTLKVNCADDNLFVLIFMTSRWDGSTYIFKNISKGPKSWLDYAL